jgi:hypothetical protein
MQISTDPAVLRAALIGYQKRLDYVSTQIDRLGRMVSGAPAFGMLWQEPPAHKHHVSPEGRARIAAAQKKRWAAARKAAR